MSNLHESFHKPLEQSFDKLDRTALSQYLVALFQLRKSMHEAESSAEELAAFDTIFAQALMVAIQRRDLMPVMHEMQMLGAVENGTEVFDLVRPFLYLHFESKKIITNERLFPHVPIIGVVGKIASGKGTVAKILAERYDILSFPFSDRLRGISRAFSILPPYERKDLRKINDILKPQFGSQIFVEWTINMAIAQTINLHVPDVIVVDGFRSVKETEYFLTISNTHLIALVADFDPTTDRKIRFMRQKERARGPEDSAAFADFEEDDKVEGAWIDPIIEFARTKGLTILNNGTTEELKRKIFLAFETISSQTPQSQPTSPQPHPEH